MDPVGGEMLFRAVHRDLLGCGWDQMTRSAIDAGRACPACMYENANPLASKKTTKRKNEGIWQLKMIIQGKKHASEPKKEKKKKHSYSHCQHTVSDIPYPPRGYGRQHGGKIYDPH